QKPPRFLPKYGAIHLYSFDYDSRYGIDAAVSLPSVTTQNFRGIPPIAGLGLPYSVLLSTTHRTDVRDEFSRHQGLVLPRSAVRAARPDHCDQQHPAADLPLSGADVARLHRDHVHLRADRRTPVAHRIEKRSAGACESLEGIPERQIDGAYDVGGSSGRD